MNSQTWWFVARSGGIIAWALLALGTFWGLALSSRFLGRRPRPNWMLDLHRFIGGLAVVFTGVHVAAIVADSYVHFGPVEVLVPFTGDYHPVAVGWGIVSMYLLFAVQLTSMLRKRLSKRLWRATHMLSFPLFALSTIHLVAVGTDQSSPWLRLPVVGAVAAICAATAVRVARLDRSDRARRLAPAT